MLCYQLMMITLKIMRVSFVSLIFNCCRVTSASLLDLAPAVQSLLNIRLIQCIIYHYRLKLVMHRRQKTKQGACLVGAMLNIHTC